MFTNHIKNSKLFLILLVCFAFTNSLYSQNKDEVFENLKKKFEKVFNVDFNFISKDENNLKGNLISDNMDRYKFTTKDKSIICDGNSIWNFNKKDNQVIISKFKKNASISIQNIFFNISQNFYPSQLQSLQAKKTYNLMLTLNSNKNPEDKINLILTKKLDIKEISFNYSGISGNYIISKFKINTKINTNDFSFSVPNGVEVIDLRK